MDLIDKKLSDKLKLFEYIDKKYWTNIDELNFRKRETASNTGSKEILQNENYSNNILYDNIYSDFKANSYKSYFYSPSTNTLDSNIKKQYSKLTNRKHSKKMKKYIKIQTSVMIKNYSQILRETILIMLIRAKLIKTQKKFIKIIST